MGGKNAFAAVIKERRRKLMRYGIAFRNAMVVVVLVMESRNRC